MAVDIKISDLPAATTVGDTDLIPIVQGGTTKKAAQNQVCTKIFDGSHVLAADFGVRKLFLIDGTTEAIAWYGSTVQLHNGDFVIDASGFHGVYSDGTLTAISGNDRQLIASDGSTVALDWSDPTLLKVFGFDFISSAGTLILPVPSLYAGGGLFHFDGVNWSSDSNIAIASTDGNTFFDNSGFHGIITAAGVIDGSNAGSGVVGEYISSLIAIGSATSLTTATAKNITSISLTAGDWDVEGLVSFTEGTATVSARTAGINTTSATIPTDGSEGYCGVQSTLTSELNSITLPRKRISIASTTTVYLVGKATFSAGSCSGFGAISARRIR